MQIHRLTEIVFALLKNDRITAKILAERFEVSTRTIYRDIDALSAAGIPVYTDKGNGGGITINENYRLSNAMLSESEKQNLITVLTAYNASLNDDEINKLLEKLSGVFKKTNSFIEVDFSDWKFDGKVQETFDALQKSIIEKRVAFVEYRNAAGDLQERELEPLKLVFKHRDWYLFAYCRMRCENRLFKLARVQKIRLLDSTFDRVCTESNIARQLEWRGDLTAVTLKISKDLKGRVYESFERETFQEDENGDFIIKNQIPLDEWIYSFFLSYGDKAEILEPLWLKEKIRQIHKRAAEI